MEEPTLDQVKEERRSRRVYRYTFFKTDRSWRSLDANVKSEWRSQFLDLLRRRSKDMDLRYFSLVGTRGDVDFMLWITAEDLHDIQDFVSELLSTGLGKYLDIPYSFLAMTKRSRYIGSHKHEGQEGTDRPPSNSKYVFVYPMVKKREWYKVPFAERQKIMADHFKTGHKYPSIRINTGYSFGLDDQEFVVSFEADDPAEFLDLVEELRTSDASKYTEKETPIFTCVAVDPETMISLLG